jgi:hypothetical protein
MTLTPEQKAKELVNKIYQPLGHLKCGVNNTIMWEYAKQSALLCVDEILDIHFDISCDAQERCVNKVLNYYQQVKTEIEKL